MQKKISVGIVIIAGVIGLLLLGGCATAVSINRNVAAVNYSDGIDEQEAGYIAQKYCLDEGIKDAFISFPVVEEHIFNRGRWKVTFQKKDLSQFEYSYILFIDKETGKVTNFIYEE